MIIFGIPYALPIAVLLGFTALIPIFGSIVGTILGAVLVFMVSPFKAIVFIGIVLIIQQIENNLIYPKVQLTNYLVSVFPSGRQLWPTAQSQATCYCIKRFTGAQPVQLYILYDCSCPTMTELSIAI